MLAQVREVLPLPDMEEAVRGRAVPARCEERMDKYYEGKK